MRGRIGQMLRSGIKQNAGNPYDMVSSLIGDEIMDQLDGPKVYSKPTLFGAAGSVMQKYAHQKYVVPKLEEGVVVPAIHDDGHAEHVLEGIGEQEAITDINKRLDVINTMSDKELREYKSALDFGSQEDRDRIMLEAASRKAETPTPKD